MNRVINIIVGLALCGAVWSVFYYWTVPLLLRSFGKGVRKSREYEAELERILKEDDYQAKLVRRSSDIAKARSLRLKREAEKKGE